jgi:Uncharacterized conserved protein (DUF2075)
LNEKDDVRSSYYLEDPATEFDIQGLELDWVGVCWDADFRAVDGLWRYHSFRGTVWQNGAAGVFDQCLPRSFDPSSLKSCGLVALADD